MSEKKRSRRKKRGRKKKRIVRWETEPFIGWILKNLPKCVRPANHYSKIGLGKRQRVYVLNHYGYKDYQSYLQSELWLSIRDRMLKKHPRCGCGCGVSSSTVHHRTYSEANLLGKTLRGLICLSRDCHYRIEFDGKRKVGLGKANSTLKQDQASNSLGKTIQKALAIALEFDERVRLDRIAAEFRARPAS